MIFQVRFQVLEKRVKVPSKEYDCGHFYQFEHVIDEVEAVNAEKLEYELEEKYSHENNLVCIPSNGSGELEVYHFISIDFRANRNDSWRPFELEEFSYRTENEKWEKEHAKREALKKLERSWTYS